MRKLDVISKDGIFKDTNIIAGIFEQGDCISVNEGITKDEFHSILDKASQPIDKEDKND